MKDLPTNHLNKLNENANVLDTSISGSLSINDADCFIERDVKAVNNHLLGILRRQLNSLI